MKYFSFLLTLFISTSLSAQDYWSKRIDIDKGEDFATSVYNLDSKLVIAFRARCPTIFKDCPGVLSVNYSGEVQHQFIIDSSLRFNTIKPMAIYGDSIYLNVNYSPWTQDSINMFSILKLDKNLNFLSEFKYGDYTGNYSPARDIAAAVNGIYTLALENESEYEDIKQPLRVFDYSNNLVWERDIEEGNPYDFAGYPRVRPDGWGGLYLSFPACDFSDDCKGYFQRFDSIGALLWTHTTDLERQWWDYDTYLTVLPNDMGLVGKWHQDSFGFFIHSIQPIIFRLSPDGALLWERIFYPQLGEELTIHELFTTRKGNIIAAGSWRHIDDINPNATPYYGGYAACFSPEGELLWQRRINDHRWWSKYGVFYSGTELENGDLVFVGQIDDIKYPDDPKNMWIVKTDSMGCLQPGCQDTNLFVVSNSTPYAAAKKATDFVVFPNPSTGQVSLVATMSNALPKGEYHYAIIDQLGREIQAPKRIVRPEIIQSIDLSALADGLYFMHVFWNGKVVESMPVVLKK